MGWRPKNLAVSLVDDAFLFSAARHAEPLALPAYVAFQRGKQLVLAGGEEARAMYGKEPESIEVVKVLVEGNITDHVAAAALFRLGCRRLLGATLFRPKVIIAAREHAPVSRAAANMAIAGGAREAYLLAMSLATAMGDAIDG